FGPEDVDLTRRRVEAFRFEGEGWRRTTCPLPDIAHDMGFYTTPDATRRAKRVKALGSGLPFTGYALGHKWTLHEKLLRTPYAAYVPETELLRSPNAAVRLAARFGAVMVKPRDGKQGKGIVKISRAESGARTFRWQERASSEGPLAASALAARLGARFRPASAVVQRWMDIRCPMGGVYDIRALVQKTEGDAWRLTEMAVRQSGLGRIASNVSGGGSVRPMAEFVALMYGEGEAERIVAECRNIADGLPPALEAAYGRRFVELGIDLAVEKGGGVRIIEVNIKPGKKIVRALSGERAYADALAQPIRYAKWLSDRRDSLGKGS
ncbi:MAG TPA: YheC/YheD family protein, partial [Paenibacillus sp.]|nr:YheC/YheD family protein [Paenibacillus sp.]